MQCLLAAAAISLRVRVRLCSDALHEQCRYSLLLQLDCNDLDQDCQGWQNDTGYEPTYAIGVSIN